jgi:phage tail-like protein
MSELSDPLPTYNFVVKVQGTEIGWFTECSGLTVERGVRAQPEGGVNDYVPQLPGAISYSKITLKRGLADNVLWDWFRTGWYDGKVERRHVTIALLNPDHSEARHWDMTNAYPVRWAGPDFQADNAQVGVETLELASGGGAEQTLVQRALDEESSAVQDERMAALDSELDLSVLADKVYALLKQELSVERERSGRQWS